MTVFREEAISYVKINIHLVNWCTVADLEILEGGFQFHVDDNKKNHNLLLNVSIVFPHKKYKALPVEKPEYVQTVLILSHA